MAYFFNKRNNSIEFIKKGFVLMILLSKFVVLHAQEVREYKGVVLASDTSQFLGGIHVLNLSSKASVVSDNMGTFFIPYKIGDSIEFRHDKWETKWLTTQNLKDSVFLKKKSIILDEVVVRVNTRETYLNDLLQLEKEKNKKMGIYYGGRPPIALLSPFGGKPLTFFYELFSKNGRSARKMHKTIQNERDNHRIDRIFNTDAIKSVIPIEEKDIELFKQIYRPTLQEVSTWNTYDLLSYIQKSFEAFKEEDNRGSY